MTPKEVFDFFVSKAPGDPDIVPYFDMLIGAFYVEGKPRVVSIEDNNWIDNMKMVNFVFEDGDTWAWTVPHPDNHPINKRGVDHSMKTAAGIMAYYRPDDPRYAVKA